MDDLKKKIDYFCLKEMQSDLHSHMMDITGV